MKLWLKDVAWRARELRKVVRSRSGQVDGVSGPLPQGTQEKKDSLELLKQESKEHTVTLVYGALGDEGAQRRQWF